MTEIKLKRRSPEEQLAYLGAQLAEMMAERNEAQAECQRVRKEAAHATAAVMRLTRERDAALAEVQTLKAAMVAGYLAGSDEQLAHAAFGAGYMWRHRCEPGLLYPDHPERGWDTWRSNPNAEVFQ